VPLEVHFQFGEGLQERAQPLEVRLLARLYLGGIGAEEDRQTKAVVDDRRCRTKIVCCSAP